MVEGELFDLFVNFVLVLDNGVLSVSVDNFLSMPATVIDAWRILTNVRASVRELERQESEMNGPPT